MHIHALSLIKNEADVIGQSLAAAAAWADCIYVYDNGSDDGTWEIVRELAATHPGLGWSSMKRPTIAAVRVPPRAIAE